MSHQGSSSSPRFTALVVDDDRFIQMLHRKLLEKIGIEALAVVNGKEAVDLHRDGQGFNLILMDMEMPVMNGIDATREIRAMGVRCMIVGVSSVANESLRQEFLDAGLDDLLEKPLTAAKLSFIVQEMGYYG
ncbi:Signal transduction response regulator, receiver domain [Dillenia turbinata]|uniref:Signal transduction response regulator, receiver domain n=1 Tax=Dillenia turbinata TaxID=194707 RepID=A0AAN8URZ5_9MAGN